MENDVAIYLLNGMPLSEFIALFIIAMGGAVSYFVVRLLFTFITPTRQPVPKWNWKKFFVGVGKLVATLFIMPWWILYFEDLMPFLLNFFLEFPEAEEDTVKNVLVEMNQASALLSGFMFDFIAHRVIKKYIKKQ